MDEVSEQQEMARELSEAISAPAVGWGGLDEVMSSWASGLVLHRRDVVALFSLLLLQLCPGRLAKQTIFVTPF